MKVTYFFSLIYLSGVFAAPQIRGQQDKDLELPNEDVTREVASLLQDNLDVRSTEDEAHGHNDITLVERQNLPVLLYRSMQKDPTTSKYHIRIRCFLYVSTAIQDAPQAVLDMIHAGNSLGQAYGMNVANAVSSSARTATDLAKPLKDLATRGQWSGMWAMDFGNAGSTTTLAGTLGFSFDTLTDTTGYGASFNAMTKLSSHIQAYFQVWANGGTAVTIADVDDAWAIASPVWVAPPNHNKRWLEYERRWDYTTGCAINAAVEPRDWVRAGPIADRYAKFGWTGC